MNKLKNLKLPFLPIFLSICIFCLSIGYAAINSITSEITGKAYAYKQTGIFITDVSYYSDLNANENNSKVKNFVKTTLNTSIELSPSDGTSAITYLVTIYNSSANDYTFDEVVYAEEFYDNPNIIFELTDLTEGTILRSGTYLSFYITYSYLNDTISTNNVLNSYLNFKFNEVSKGYGDLKIEYVLTDAWTDNTYQFYRADFTITNVGTASINEFTITIPITDISYNAGWGSGVDVTNNEEIGGIVIKSISPLAINTPIEVTIQFGVKMNNFDFDEFIVVIDGAQQEPDTPPVNPEPEPDPDEPDPDPDEPGTDEPDPDPDEPGTDEPDPDPDEPEPDNPSTSVTPEIDTEGNYVYALGDLTIKFTPANSWSDGTRYYTQFNLSVTNNSSSQINSWSFTIDASNGEGVQQSWNLNCDDTTSGIIVVSSPNSGNMIAPGGSYTEGGIILSAPVNNYIPTLK